jgi:hypothetical protein
MLNLSPWSWLWRLSEELGARLYASERFMALAFLACVVMVMAVVARLSALEAPRTIRLVRVTAPRVRSELTEVYARSLRRFGFVDAGEYEVSFAKWGGSMPLGLRRPVAILFVHENEHARATITIQQRTSVEIVGEFLDGTVVYVSNSKELRRSGPRWSTRILMRGASVEELWSAFLVARPDKAPVELSIDSAPHRVEVGYARLVSWQRWHSGGLFFNLWSAALIWRPQGESECERLISREGGAAAGQLSTAEPADGALSQAKGKGSLSVSDRASDRES